MVSNRILGLLRLIFVAQVIVATLLFAILFVVMDLFGQFGDELRDRYVWYWFVSTLSLMIAGGSGTIDPSQRFSLQLSRAHIHRETLRLTFAVALGLMIFLVASKDQGAISRQFLFIYLALLHPCLFLSQWVLPTKLSRFILGKSRKDRALIIGEPAGDGRLIEWLALKRTVGIEALGYLSSQPEDAVGADGGEQARLRRLGALEELEEVLQKFEVTQVIIADIAGLGDRAQWLIQCCEAAGVRVIIYCDLAQRFHRNLTYFMDDGLHFVSARSEPLENPFNRVVKRLFDFSFAALVVIFILPPVAVVVWIVQRFQSPGPLFFRQVRAGLNNRRFVMLKFRTMRADHGEEARQATAGDDRVYPFGRFLRRFSLDELPQFLNVLRGEMSVVGPRPHLPEHNDQFSRVFNAYRIRSWVKPGITGLAQVRGFRGPVYGIQDIQKRVESDIEYLENWQFFLDIDIVLRTVIQMFFPPPRAV